MVIFKLCLTFLDIKKWEEEDDQIIFYLSEVNNLPICFTLLLVRKFEVEEPLPAPVSLIDYYHPEVSTTKVNVWNSLCTKQYGNFIYNVRLYKF